MNDTTQVQPETPTRTDRIPWIVFRCGLLYPPSLVIVTAILNFLGLHHEPSHEANPLVILLTLLALCCCCGAPLCTSAPLPKRLLLAVGGALLFGLVFFLSYLAYMAFG